MESDRLVVRILVHVILIVLLTLLMAKGCFELALIEMLQ